MPCPRIHLTIDEEFGFHLVAPPYNPPEWEAVNWAALLPSHPTIAFRSCMTNPSTNGQALLLRNVRGMGRGIFAGRRFRKGEIIEICPAVPVGMRFGKKCDGEVLEHYLFQWGPRGSAVVLGYGSIYNHSNSPNASFRPRMSKLELVFRALRDIEIGEQILVDYEWPDFHKELKKARRLPGQ